ncbi:MAG: FAD-dependent oxidoreductase, partial [Acidobacteriota bacterium]
MDSEVLIIGAGVIGLSIARELCKRGVRGITIVDRGTAGQEASWAAAGMLAPNIEADSDKDFHEFALESLAAYPDFAAGLFEETAVDIELDRTGTLFLAFDGSGAEELRETYRKQLARNVRVERFSGYTIRQIEPAISDAAVEALYYPDDWQVDNRKLIVALRAFADLHKIRVVENAEAVKLLTSKGDVVGAETTKGALHSRITIVATGAWTSLIKIGDAKMPIHVKPVRGQMMCFNTGSRRLRHVVYSTRGYLVPRADGRL